MTTYRTWVGQMEEILLRDYAKLKAVGIHVKAAILGGSGVPTRPATPSSL